MDTDLFEVESKTPFSESLIWRLNTKFYQEKGINAWSDDIVPHHMTSNSSVGRTYAELIFAFLKDLGAKGVKDEIVYILELGAGHGRLGFHIVKHLKKLVATLDDQVPPFCYVLSDIVEENLSFFSKHDQLQTYFEEGILDVAYFDAINSEDLYLQKAERTIAYNDLNQPLIAIANYFFDTIPNELFFIQNHTISDCSLSIHSQEDPEELSTVGLIKNMNLTYHKSLSGFPVYDDNILNNILEEYTKFNADTYIFFPKKSIECLSTLKAFSKEGLVLLTMDKGFHELSNLKNKKEPDLVTHGSFSLWVNYHALSEYCLKNGGKVLFPKFSNFHLEIGCLLFLEESDTYLQTDLAYHKVVNDFGPDDFNSIKQMAYSNVSRLRMVDLIALYRLSSYDSTIFMRFLPRLKQVKQNITFIERTRLAQTMHHVWNMYFNINEKFDLPYEIGGLFYDLGFYAEALDYFKYSIDSYGEKVDVSYNQALCYYQLREDQLFYTTLDKAKTLFPNSDLLKSLDKLDMG
jgi:SAM-dependent MidA family methyltransferase